MENLELFLQLFNLIPFFLQRLSYDLTFGYAYRLHKYNPISKYLLTYYKKFI